MNVSIQKNYMSSKLYTKYNRTSNMKKTKSCSTENDLCKKNLIGAMNVIYIKVSDLIIHQVN